MDPLDKMFDKLRRCSYERASAEYTIACLENSVKVNETQDNISLIVDPILKKMGWSLDDLYLESRRRENLG